MNFPEIYSATGMMELIQLIYKLLCILLRLYLPYLPPFVLRGHEGSNSLSFIFIFQYLNPVIKVTVIKDFGFSKYPPTSLYLIK